MQKFGIIENGKLKLVRQGVPKSKPVVYAEIPEYDQETQAVFELPPEDREDHIFVDLEVRDVPKDDVDGEMF
jgi:hypothetical protein